MNEESVEKLRNEFDLIDQKLHELLSVRCALSKRMGKLKKEKSLNVIQLKRWREVLNNRYRQNKIHDIDSTFVTKIFNLIHEESVRLQQKEFEK